MRLGEILIKLGGIGADQLGAALRHQVVYGGRLGTTLLELGCAGRDDIAHALARQHHVPAALEAHFTHFDPRAVQIAVAPQHL